MRTIFKKSNIPFMKNTLHGGSARDCWNLARTMQDENGLGHQVPAEISLLERGAYQKDVWSMCELARTYFNYCGDIFLPSALRYWKMANLQNDGGAKFDTENLPIYDRILAYRSCDGNEYKAMEMKCAMLAEWHLNRLGLSPWETIDDSERRKRTRELFKIVCRVLEIPDTELNFVNGLTHKDYIADGVAFWDNKITLRSEVLGDFERMIEVIFHELGHIVLFQIMKKTENAERLKQIYGITNERIAAWDRNEMGYEVVTTEEDPDTLSYGVYTMWATFFL